jgi:hypothetical protein
VFGRVVESPLALLGNVGAFRKSYEFTTRLPDGRPLTVRASAEVPSATGVPPPNPSPPPLISPEDVNNSMSMPLAYPDLPSGDLDPVQFVNLMEDVSALRSAIAISRAREDSLVSRVEALEALVTTLRDEQDEEEEDIVYSSRKSNEPRGRVPNRHKVRMARGAESDESSASEADDGHPAMGDRVPKGRRVEGLVELTTWRPEFRPLVDYRSYRLANRSQTVDDHVTSKVNSYLKMMRHHVSEPFTGQPAIRAFEFLSALRDAFNVNRISEAAAFLPLPHFLLGKAKHGVISRWKQVPSAMPRYPVAVQFLLQSYATPRVIASACQRVMSARHELNESEAQLEALRKVRGGSGQRV